MFSFRVGNKNVGKRSSIIRWFLHVLTFFILLILIVTIALRLFNDPIKDFTKNVSSRESKSSQQTEGPCIRHKVCPDNHIGFLIQSGAANVVPPKICVGKDLILGTVMNNAGSGINIVVVNGKTGEVLKTDHFNMYSGKAEPLIEFLTKIETGSVVLMAIYDEGSTNLNDEARKLISDMGSSMIQSLGYRDNWVFAGGKGMTGKSAFEKYMKNDESTNKYQNWPEIVEIDDCIPKYVE